MKKTLFFIILLLMSSVVYAGPLYDDALLVWQNWTEPQTIDESPAGINANVFPNWNTCTNAIDPGRSSSCLTIGLTSYTLASPSVDLPLENGFTVAMVYNAFSCGCPLQKFNGGSYNELFSYGQQVGHYDSGSTYWDTQVFRARKPFNEGTQLQFQLKTVDSNCQVTFYTPDLYTIANHLLIIDYDPVAEKVSCYFDGAECVNITSPTCTGQVNVSGSYPIGPAAVAAGGGTLQGGYHQFLVYPRPLTIEEKDTLWNNGTFVLAQDAEVPLTTFCGDGICQLETETPLDCPADCFGEGGNSPDFSQPEPAPPEVPPEETPVEEPEKPVFSFFGGERFEFIELIREIILILRERIVQTAKNPISLLVLIAGLGVLFVFSRGTKKKK